MGSPSSGSPSQNEDEDDGYEPLFDYSHIQPTIVVQDDDSDGEDLQIIKPDPFFRATGKKRASSYGEERTIKGIMAVADPKEVEEEDWLPPPPKSIKVGEISADGSSILSELRLKREELVSLTSDSADMLRKLEESAKRELQKSEKSDADIAVCDASKLSTTRQKVIITVQDKKERKQFRLYMDDKFEKLFKIYDERANGQREHFVFFFDGEKISPSQTPEDLGLTDDDMIEVYSKTG